MHKNPKDSVKYSGELLLRGNMILSLNNNLNKSGKIKF